MTQEEKDLLLKDLCARVPYGIKCKYIDWNIKIQDFITKTSTLYAINQDYIPTFKSIKNEGVFIDESEFNIEDVKPYLFPLSSMTLEQRCKVQSLLPDKCEITFTNSEIKFYGEDYHKIKLKQFEKLFNLFNMWHLDYRGLILKGLAIDATGLNIY